MEELLRRENEFQQCDEVACIKSCNFGHGLPALPQLFAKWHAVCTRSEVPFAEGKKNIRVQSASFEGGWMAI
jgi:hypothetical protein